MQKVTYEVKLDSFEGPLDLLLYLIRKDKIDIYDIPIARITDQFLEYVDLMKQLDLNIAGDFIEMASTLIRIKVQMLLPSRQDEDGVVEDPRDELVHQLIEYQKMREAATHLAGRESVQTQQFQRSPTNLPEPEEPEQMWEATLFDLLTSFLQVKEQLTREEKPHLVAKREINVEEKIEVIITALQFQKRILFFDLFLSAEDRLAIIVNFMAVLELLRQQRIRVRQNKMFGDIWIYPTPNVSQPVPASETAVVTS